MDRYHIVLNAITKKVKKKKEPQKRLPPLKRLLYRHGAVPAIYFPQGRPNGGGTCHWATRKCIKFCEATTNNILEAQVFNFFSRKSYSEVYHRILSEWKKMDNKLLFWFASGDCPPQMEKKIITLILDLSMKDEIIQMGFTRNESFWEKTLEITHCYFVLTVEDEKKAIEMSEKGIVSIPDYDKNEITLYENHEYCGGCGANWFRFEEVIRENDCNICYNNRLGCFNNVPV